MRFLESKTSRAWEQSVPHRVVTPSNLDQTKLESGHAHTWSFVPWSGLRADMSYSALSRYSVVLGGYSLDDRYDI